MTAEILVLAGGVGLFLVGMEIMTEALRALASRHLRGFLARFTTSPLTGTLTGAASTAVIQSSSATMVTVIGFVGAGLMSFPQAIGVIYGANVGTTFTGWIVALLGLKLSLGTIALPLLLVAAALAAQFSAAIADTSGSGGLIEELTRGRIKARTGYAILVSIGLLMTWSVNIFQIIAYASRAFALYYTLQSVIAARRAFLVPGNRLRGFGFILLAILGLMIVLFGNDVESSNG